MQSYWLITISGRRGPHVELLTQETRRLVGALMQHITYSEFLPIVIGRNAMGPLDRNYAYDQTIDPAISNVFSTAAFRLEDVDRLPDGLNNRTPLDFIQYYKHWINYWWKSQGIGLLTRPEVGQLPYMVYARDLKCFHKTFFSATLISLPPENRAPTTHSNICLRKF